MAGATERTAQAMQQLTAVADDAGGLSREVLQAAADIGQNAETLRAEVDRFLAATAEDSAGTAGSVPLAA